MKKDGLGTVLRDAWRLTSPYFRSEERWSARLLLATIIVMNFGLVGLNVLLNAWNGALFNTFQTKDGTAFIDLLLTWHVEDGNIMPGFLGIATVYIAVAVYRTWLRQLLIVRWRRWSTERLLADWLSDRAYYTIGLQSVAAGPAGSITDNPDQRIAEDVRSFTEDTLTLGLDLLSKTVTVISFAQILWTLSGSVTLWGVSLPGYMFFIAIAYAVVGTGLAHWVGWPLAHIDFLRQKLEADFRFALVRVRENLEGVALYAGERSETRVLLVLLNAVVANTRALMSRQKKLNTFVAGYGQISGIFPFVIAAPRFFSGAITLGDLTRIAGAFSEVQDSASWFINSYDKLATWRATVERLTGFHQAIGTARGLADAGVQVREGKPGAITLHDVSLHLPDGRALLNNGGLVLPQGQSTVLSGRSGTGKSTLFRAMAGIWPFGSGTVERPPGSSLFLPQRPYIPLGTLRQALTYPADPGTIPDVNVHQALSDAGLEALLPALDREEPWAQRLSGGEQQRLAIARALLLKPDWLFLDEATASLDPEGQAALYQILRERLPGTTILSISHRPELAQWHDRSLKFQNNSLVPSPLPAKEQPGVGEAEPELHPQMNP